MVPGAVTGGLCAQVPTEFDVPRVFDLDSYSKENLLQPEAEHDVFTVEQIGRAHV